MSVKTVHLFFFFYVWPRVVKAPGYRVYHFLFILLLLHRGDVYL